MAKVRKIGIMGGTFDPIHFGHLRAAEESLQKLNLDEVVFIPVGMPPHKLGSKITDAEMRYEMTRLAIADNERFSVSRIEIEKKTASYTKDTLLMLRNMPEYKNAELFFITGYDAVLNILSWKDPDELVKLCKFVAISRPGYSPAKIEEFPAHIRAAIIQIEIPMLAISSTDIRNKIKNGETIKYLLPSSLEKYIKENDLYV